MPSQLGWFADVRLRELAAELRWLRVRSGLTVEEVTKHLKCSSSKVSRLETAERKIILQDLQKLCRVSGPPP